MKKLTLLLVVIGIAAVSCKHKNVISEREVVLTGKDSVKYHFFYDNKIQQKGIVTDIVVSVVVPDGITPDGIPQMKGFSFHNLSIREIVKSLNTSIKSTDGVRFLTASIEINCKGKIYSIPACTYELQRLGDSVYFPSGKLVHPFKSSLAKQKQVSKSNK